MEHDLEANKRVVMAVFERIVGQGDWDNALNYFTADFRAHGTGPETTGLDGLQRLTNAWRRAFPDWRDEIDDVIAERDMVTLRIRASGTHLGKLAGIPATGEKCRWGMIEILRVEKGKVAEQWGYSDFGNVLTHVRAVAESKGLLSGG